MSTSKVLQAKAGTAVSVVALALVVVAPAAASARGLVGFGRDMLALSGGWELLVPVTLDGAALYAAALSLRAILSGDSAGGARFLVVLYALGSAGFNGAHALYAVSADGGVPAAAYFAGMSVSAVVLWETTLRQLRRGQLRELGALPAELPRFSPLRWLLAPLETPRVWRFAVLHEITVPQEALAQWRASRVARSGKTVTAARMTDLPETSSPRVLDESAEPTPASASEPAAPSGAAETEHTESAGDSNVREFDAVDQERRRVEEVRDSGGAGSAAAGSGESAGLGCVERERGSALAAARRGIADDVRKEPEAVAPDLTGMTKRAALQHAFEVLGAQEVPAARAWLEEHDVHIDESYAFALARDEKTRKNANIQKRQAATVGLRVVGKE